MKSLSLLCLAPNLISAKETYALKEALPAEEKRLQQYSDTLCLTDLDQQEEVCILHYVKVNLGYEWDQDYSQIGTAGADDDQRYYSLKLHTYTFADFELEPTIFVPEKIDLTLTFSINQFFGSIFGEG